MARLNVQNIQNRQPISAPLQSKPAPVPDPAPSHWEYTSSDDNFTAEVDGNVLTVTVDLSRTIGITKAGRSRVVAKTGWMTPVATHPDIQFEFMAVKKGLKD